LAKSKGGKVPANLVNHTFKKGWKGGPGRPPGTLVPSLRRLSQDEFSEIADMVIRGNVADLEVIARDKQRSGVIVLTANALMGAYKRKEFSTVNQVLDRIFGKSAIVIRDERVKEPTAYDNKAKPRTFEEFCETAKYPAPFPKQKEMREFGMRPGAPRLLLGSRGYGKTDYVTMLGVAYEIYLDFHNPKPVADNPKLIAPPRHHANHDERCGAKFSHAC